MYDRGIGFIDSGVGGLTVVKEAMKQLPNEKFYYLGDTARCPYGPRSEEEVKQFSFELAHFLVKKHDIKMLVIACNTATAASLNDLKKELDIPVIGVILPGSRAAIKTSKNGHISVIGTEGTINSDQYSKELLRKNNELNITSLSCPKFASMVEKNSHHLPIAKRIVRESLLPLKNNPMDTLILGCTHYPLIKHLIQNVVGPNVELIDSGAETINEVSVLLDYYDLANYNHHPDIKHIFYTTGDQKQFYTIAREWLNKSNFDVKHIDLKELQVENDE